MTHLFEAKPFIIAEVGSNWRSLEDCFLSIAMAKAAGADAVKFQAFTCDALYGPKPADWNDVWAMSHELPLEWLPKLKHKADLVGIEFMCTAFSPELVEAVDPFVEVHKVASSDLTYPQLLDAVAKTRKPTILSTGASGRGDIHRALGVIDPARTFPTNAVILYCVAAYPAVMADLRVMELLSDEFPTGKVGFSDHTLGIYMAIEAARKGAVVIEKHFTAIEADTPDRPHSLTTDEFKIMVDHIRGRGQPVIGPTPEEKDMVLRHNRRLITTKDVEPGEKLEYGVNFGAYRSLEEDSRGLTPFAWASVDGRIATVILNRGKAIGPGDFK